MIAESSVSQSPDVLSGALVFAGTRVPVETLFDYLITGDSADDFLVDFPTVSRDQATNVLRSDRNF